MDRLRDLIHLHPDLLGDQPVFEALIRALNDAQADRLADMLNAFIETLGSDSAQPQRTLH